MSLQYPSNVPPQATALKTSSGKGDLQCSATNAGDWVCISQFFINLIIDGTDDHPFTIITITITITIITIITITITR